MSSTPNGDSAFSVMLAQIHRIESELQFRLELDALITRISTSFINLPDDQIDGGIEGALQLIGQFIGADRGYIYRYSADKHWMIRAYDWNAAAALPYHPRPPRMAIGDYPWFNLNMIQRGIVLYLRRASDLPPEAAAERRIIEQDQVESMIAIPMESREQAIGFIGFTARVEHQWHQDTIDLLKILSSIFSNVLERQHAQAVQAGQHRFLELLATAGSVAEALHALVQLIEKQLPGMLGLIMLLDGHRLHVGASVRLPPEYLAALDGLEIGPLAGSCGAAAANGQRVIVDDITADARWERLRPLALDHHLRACWSEPVLASNGAVVGTFAMYYAQPRFPTEAELQTLHTAAHMAGVAIEHKGAQEALRLSKMELEQRVEERTAELEQRKQIAESLRSTIAVINSNRSLREILDYIAVQARDLLRADACVLHRVDLETERVTLETCCGWPEDLMEPNVLSLTPAGDTGYRDTVLLRRVTFGNYPPGYAEAAHHDLDLDPKMRARKAVIRTRYAASLSAPLLIKDELFGSLVFYYEAPQDFPAEQVETASVFAEQAALAIENARLREQVGRSAAEAERGRLARDLHDSVTQTLFSASLIAEVLPRVWDENPAEARQYLEDVRLLTRGALAEMRTLLLELRPATLLQAELGESLRHLVDAATAQAGIPIKLHIEGREPIPPEVKVSLYRIAQEALNNITKHAEATQASVTLDSQPESIYLGISDDGRGFDPTAVSPEHLGLSIMTERAQSMGAHLTIDSQPGQGTRVVICRNREGC